MPKVGHETVVKVRETAIDADRTRQRHDWFPGNPKKPKILKTAKKSKTRILPRKFFRHFLKDQNIGSYGKNQANL